MAKMTEDQKRWRAEADADTLAMYEEIMSDSSRRNAAIRAARTRANELNKRADVMNKVAGTKSRKK